MLSSLLPDCNHWDIISITLLISTPNFWQMKNLTKINRTFKVLVPLVLITLFSATSSSIVYGIYLPPFIGKVSVMMCDGLVPHRLFASPSIWNICVFLIINHCNSHNVTWDIDENVWVNKNVKIILTS